MVEAIFLSYLGIMWTGLGIYMARFYWRQYRSDPDRQGQNVPLMFGQGFIWAFGIFLFVNAIARAVN